MFNNLGTFNKFCKTINIRNELIKIHEESTFEESNEIDILDLDWLEFT